MAPVGAAAFSPCASVLRTEVADLPKQRQVPMFMLPSGQAVRDQIAANVHYVRDRKSGAPRVHIPQVHYRSAPPQCLPIHRCPHQPEVRTPQVRTTPVRMYQVLPSLRSARSRSAQRRFASTRFLRAPSGNQAGRHSPPQVHEEWFEAAGTDDLVVFCLFAEEAFERPDQGVGEGPWLIAITIFWFLIGVVPQKRIEIE